MNKEENNIIIAGKPIDRYLLTTLWMLKNNPKIQSLTLNARGSQNIAKAILIAGILKTKENLNIKHTEIFQINYRDVKTGNERLGVEIKILLEK